MGAKSGRDRSKRVVRRLVTGLVAVAVLVVAGLAALGELPALEEILDSGDTADGPVSEGSDEGVGAGAGDGLAEGSLQEAISRLPEAPENRTGYVRERFEHWVDDDGDGCNTRYEVLIAEAVAAPSVGSGCRLEGGRWESYYDGAEWTDPADLDIDHMVPLAEAWDSGASAWTDEQRRAYANDLGDPRSLVAVTDRENQAKSDKDPAEWLPPAGGSEVTCRYLAEWVAVKIRWSLTVDPAERAALASSAETCPATPLTVTPAL